MKKADAREQPLADAARFLILRLQERLYALPVGSVAEVIRAPMVARVPQAPIALLGVANLRGAILPLVSLRGLLGMSEPARRGDSRAIVLDIGTPVAITVDSVESVLTVESAAIQTNPVTLGGEAGERLTGAFPLGESGGVAKVLDIPALLAQAFGQRDRLPRQAVQRSAANAPQGSRGPDAIVQRETLVTVEVAGQEFAFNIEAVQEIVSLPDEVAVVPRAEAPIVGMIAFREQLLPLLSLRALLGFAPATVADRRQKIIVASVAGSSVGLVADRARAVIAADVGRIEPAPAVLAARTGGEARVKSVYRGGDGQRLISILAPEQLFREDVMERLNVGQSATQPTFQSDVANEERSFLVFRLGDDEFGLPVEAVEEVARVPAQITRIPKTPRFLEGVVNLRGEVLPVVDQRRRFDMPRLERGEGRRLLIVRAARHRAGLIVDSVSDVIGVALAAIEGAPDLMANISRLVTGVVNLERDGRLVLLLDPAELLTRTELGMLDAFEDKTRKAS